MGYKCKTCAFSTESKKEIREHVKVKHKIKGGKATAKEIAITGSLRKTPISEYYTRE